MLKANLISPNILKWKIYFWIVVEYLKNEYFRIGEMLLEKAFFHHYPDLNNLHVSSVSSYIPWHHFWKLNNKMWLRLVLVIRAVCSSFCLF
jgi:hypothetical protein